MNSKIFEILSAVPYLESLSPKIAETIANEAQQLIVVPKQIVFLEGDSSDALYFVESGGLKAIKTSPSGREQILHFIDAGEPFNEMNALAGIANSVTVIALEQSVLWKIKRETILKIIDTNPEIAKYIIQHLAKRFHSLLTTVEDLSLRSIEARLARYLLSESEEAYIERPTWATQSELASRLGTVPDVLHRALKTLSKENLIHVERRKITILNRERLQERSERDK